MSDSIVPRKVLLIVEDEPDLASILKDTLEPICDEVLMAENGFEALQTIKNNSQICAVLSDISMPKMTGLELLSHLRTDFNPIPFIVLTGFGDSKSYQQAIKLNATDFLEKPFNPEETSEIVNKALEYGIALKQSELELENLYRDSGIEEEKLAQIKRAKRTVMSMRIENSIYVKKGKA